MKKTFVYKDLLNDDFAGTDIKRLDLPDNFRYISKNPLWNAASFVFYRFIATPLVFLFQKILYGQRIKNRKVLRKYRKEGYFIYSNHTLTVGDAFTPTLVAFPKKAYILVSPDAFSIPIVKDMVKMLGGMPTPDKISELRAFREAINARAQKGNALFIYPEAHIWPYYTKIRPFKDASFKYPAENGKAVFCVTNTFKKHFLFNFPIVTTYIDGPFFPDEKLTVKENQKKLRDEVYQTMVRRSESSTYEHCVYVDGNNKEAPQEEERRFQKEPTPFVEQGFGFSHTQGQGGAEEELTPAAKEAEVLAARQVAACEPPSHSLEPSCDFSQPQEQGDMGGEDPSRA